MPGPAGGPGQTQDPRNLRWTLWNDFRPGIISQAKFAYGANDNAAPVPYTGQPAAAQPNGTFGCLALPNGGLAPMPGQAATFTAPSGAFQNGVNNYITGAIAYGEVSSSSGGFAGDELVYCIESIASGNRLQAIVATQTGGAWNRILHSTGPTASAINETFAFTAALTRANPTDPTGAATGVAVLAMTTGFLNPSASNGYTGILLYYPDPTNPGGTATPKDYSTDLPGQAGGGLTGWLFAHEGRIVILPQQVSLWTPSSALSDEFDHFYFTDPANTVPGNGNIFSLAQNEIFVPEWPVGTGALGSISAGELVVMKKSGGGYLVSGDLDGPTVTSLPGVTPAPNNSHSAASPIGLVYLVQNGGAWVWNGSNVSQKISNQLNDDFFLTASPARQFGPGQQAIAWDDLVVTGNNYVYDTVTGGWWKLDNQAVPFTFFGLSHDHIRLYGFPRFVTSSSSPVAYAYDKTAPATQYQWKSHPLEQSLFRSIVVREVVIRAQGTGTITVTLEGTGGSSDATTPTTMTLASPTQPVYVRFDTGCEAQDITVTINSQGTGGNSAPIVYGVAIGIVETLPYSAT